MGRARLGTWLGGTALLLLSVPARAAEPAGAGAPPAATAATPAGTMWDDRHMQSSFARYLDARTARPAIQGIDRDGRIARDAGPAPTGVPELVLHLSPHEWRRGGSIGSSAGATQALSTSSFSWSDDSGTVDRSSGLRGQSSLHGSAHSGAR